jgi:hypothetical protein
MLNLIRSLVLVLDQFILDIWAVIVGTPHTPEDKQ